LTEPTGEQLKTLIDIVNKIRMLKSWDVLPAGKAEAYARTWAEVLDFAKVPRRSSVYNRLYQMGFERQVDCRERGLEIPEMTADYFVSQWKILKEKLQEEEIKRGRTLPENAESVCKHCHGSGFRQVADGKYVGAIKCNHKD